MLQQYLNWIKKNMLYNAMQILQILQIIEKLENYIK